jgi:hypothetical protein
MWHVWGERMMHAGFEWKNIKGRNHLEEAGLDMRII